MSDSISARIEKNVWNYYKMPTGGAVRHVPAAELLSSDRLDVMARYVFVRQRELGWGVGWATSVYRHFLETFSPVFHDGDGTKSSFSDYLKSFSALADGVSKNGWDREAGLIPHVEDTVVDGAHRLAVALYHGISVDAVELDGAKQIMSAQHLLDAGMSPVIVKQLINEYLKLDNQTYAAFLFPAPLSQQEHAIARIKACAKAVYTEEIFLSDQGRCNLIELLYGHEDWWQESQLDHFVKLRFPSGGSVKVVFFKSEVGSRPVKEQARLAYSDLHFVHTNDTHEETIWLGDLLLNPNGIQYLNMRPTHQPPRFKALLKRFVDHMPPQAAYRAYCIDSGAVLAAFGLRDCGDLDYITPEARIPLLAAGPDISWHNEEYISSPIPVDELVANPAHHFIYKGVKFMSLDTVMFFKRKRWAPKDAEDCQRILDAKYKIPLRDRLRSRKARARLRMRELIESAPWRLARVMRSILPAMAFRFLRSAYRRYKGIRTD